MQATIIGLASAADAWREGFAEGIRPTPDLTVWEWADAKRIIAGEAAAEPGLYRTDRTPYLREIMDALSPGSDTKVVAIMKATQLGLTEVGNNWAGHCIDVDPGPMAMYFPTDTDANEHSKTKLTPSIEATDCLRAKITDAPGHRGRDTVKTKLFQGGVLYIMGAESPRNFRHKTIKKIMADEIDEWPLDVGGQGDPTELLMNRMDTFSQSGGKVYLLSTPTVHKLSKIERWFDTSDQRRFRVPCPLCGEHQVLVWKQLKYERDEDYNLLGEPLYECAHCFGQFGEHHKTAMLAAGYWVPTYPERSVRGYHISSLYSPLGWLSWATMAEEWLRAHKDADITKQKRFINTRLGEVWKEDTDAHDPKTLISRREAYAAPVPMGVALLTASVDVQKDRLEVEVRGWGPGNETWGIEHHIIHGTPTEDQVWVDLDLFFFDSRYTHESGAEMRIAAMGLDTGYETDRVYKYVRQRQGRRVFAFKGKGGDRALVDGPSKVDNKTVKLYTVGTDTAKERIFGQLRITTPGRGYCHFPMAYTEEYFEQLTGEVKVIDRGVRRFIPRRAGQPVEALDLFVYNLAVLQILDPNMPAVVRNLARKAARATSGSGQPEQQALPTVPAPTPATTVAPRPPARQPLHRPKPGNFGINWKQKRR